jgi:uncharacterized peroxidase-related enzyme
MYLPQVENNPDAAGAYVPLIGSLRASGLPVPQIMHLFAFKPEATQHLQHFTQAVMRGPSPLTPAFRELIAAFVSSRNRCRFCTGSHVAVAAKLSADPSVVDAVVANYRAAPIEEREKALLAYLEGLTAEPTSASEAEVEKLRQAGWSDEAIYDAVTVCAIQLLQSLGGRQRRAGHARRSVREIGREAGAARLRGRLAGWRGARRLAGTGFPSPSGMLCCCGPSRRAT